MLRLILSLTTAFLACNTLASPIITDANTNTNINTTGEDLIALYGPLSTWKEIKLVDAFPDALIDGKPADPSVVYARIPPVFANKALNTAAATHAAVPPREEDSTQGRYCYGGEKRWVIQYQLYSVSENFCTAVQAQGITNGAQLGVSYNLYLSASGSWADFTDIYGATVPNVWYWVQINPGYIFNYYFCLKAINDIIDDCHGGNQESHGGYWNLENGGWTNAAVNPALA